jgi:hypothetical protein
VKAETILAPLVDAADALSGARPGARREMMESYVRRLEELERITNSFRGVEKSYAVQAGREIRIMVQHDIVSDDEASRMARDIARKIETEMTYPGQIKVTVIREVRSVDYARNRGVDSYSEKVIAPRRKAGNAFFFGFGVLARVRFFRSRLRCLKFKQLG